MGFKCKTIFIGLCKN